MIRRSFSEFHAQRDNKDKKRRLEKGSTVLATLKEIECIFGEPDIDNYKRADEDLVRVNWDINDFILQVPHLCVCT
jgi:antiviral helicase SKI2